MARCNVNDGSSGRLGNVIIYPMYGKSYMRSLPSQYNDKKSKKQLAQRQKMQLVNVFLGPFKDVLRITFKSQAVGRAAHMAAKSYNMLNAIGSEYPEQYIDYTKAMVSLGSVPLPSEASIVRTDEGVLFQWKHDEQEHPLDTLFVIAQVRGQNNVEYKQTEAERRDESYLWKMDCYSKEPYDIWLVFRDYKERGFSNSRWLELQ
ncbi:DUF6266 family protein [Carboxylicivirga marina]|uniref:DUF6266 family protein n=1 Tax=Carboxylicivirga marina TaxID=2800988 RepID=UPI002595FF73|nr:DUF6266 family protein [uncultured Carboxylicivirga sp.]